MRCSHPLQIKSVIRRTKESPNVHPMYRDGHLRRKMGPIIVNKNNSQDRLIEELQGKFGIGRSERRRKQTDEWLAEGVVGSKPQRFNPDGAGSEVDKVGFSVLSSLSKHFSRVYSPSVSSTFSCLSAPFSLFSSPLLQVIILPESPVPVRKVLPPLSPPTPHRPPIVEEPKRPLRVPEPPLPIPPPPPPPPPQRSYIEEQTSVPPQQIMKAAPPPSMPPVQEPPAPKPEPPPPVLRTPTEPPPVETVPPVVPKVLVSIGCQTEYDPIFPPMQA